MLLVSIPSHLTSYHLLKDTGWTLLHSLTFANAVQAVQEYVSHPSFKASEMLMKCKTDNEHTIAIEASKPSSELLEAVTA